MAEEVVSFGMRIGVGCAITYKNSRSERETVRRVPLELWLSAYGVASEPRWGWIGAISLA